MRHSGESVRAERGLGVRCEQVRRRGGRNGHPSCLSDATARAAAWSVVAHSLHEPVLGLVRVVRELQVLLTRGCARELDGIRVLEDPSHVARLPAHFPRDFFGPGLYASLTWLTRPGNIQTPNRVAVLC